MRTLTNDAKKRFIEDMQSLVKPEVLLTAFFPDIEEKIEYRTFEIAARYMKDGRPFLYYFNDHDFEEESMDYEEN